MTPEEHQKLTRVGNDFWEEFGKLVAEHVARMPDHLEHVTIVYLQELCSISGSQFNLYLDKLRRGEKIR